MAGTVYTPVTLWTGFKHDLPIEETYMEYEKNGLVYRKIHFSGRFTEKGRVELYALAAFDKKNATMPAVLILPNYTKPVDEATVSLIARHGYYAFMLDYAANGREGECSFYPEDVAYARYDGDDSRIHRITVDAKNSCWYEWCAAARYACYYLSGRDYISAIGGFGIKHGATILWQLSGLEKLSCAVMAFNAGWHEYRGNFKYGDEEPEVTDEMYKYLAAIEPQSYAQYVKCPVLLLAATNNPYFDVDRAYDTVQRIDKNIETFVDYAVQCNRFLDHTAFNDMFIFLDSQLGGSGTVLPHRTEISCEKRDGYLWIRVRPDMKRLVSLTLYACEQTVDPALRCWNVAAERVADDGEGALFRYAPYKNSRQAFFFASAAYESGFTICSRILACKFGPSETNNANKSTIVYSSRDNKYLMQPYIGAEHDIVAYMRMSPAHQIKFGKGAFDIEGITCEGGLRTLKINNEKNKPNENSILLLDVYAPAGGTLRVSLTEGLEKDETLYSVTAHIGGGNVWHSCSFALGKFKTAEGMVLKNFDRVNSIVFEFDGDYLLNNIIWV